MTLIMRLSSVFVLILAATLCAQAQVPEGWATITGQVLDARGKPVSGASISLFPSAAFSGGLPGAITDKDGYYRMFSPPFGKAWLCAVKMDAGYPDTNSLLFAPEVDDRPEVFIAPGSHLNQDIHLAPPVGILEGNVIDAVTKAVVPNGRIAMRREKPQSMYSEGIPKNGHFLYALPAAPIEVIVSAPGYQMWRYKDPDNGADRLILSNSSHRKITIELIPNKGGAPPSPPR